MRLHPRFRRRATFADSLTLIKKYALFMIISSSVGSLQADPGSITMVDRPDATGTNSFYTSNRKPLAPSRLIKLPVGSIRPEGWLLEYLKRQRAGLTGHLAETSVWLQKEDNAWLSKDGKGKYGWEEVPYWLKGYGNLGYILNDPEVIAEARIWLEGAINSQRADGDFGPDQRFEDGSRDYWANMVMLFCLQSYFEHSHDRRVIDLMTRYFRHQLSVPAGEFLTHYWQKMRGGDNLLSVYWLYNQTGEAFLLELAEKIHRATANWKMAGDLPDWHCVNIAQGFREPATYYLQSKDPADLQATYDNFREVRVRYGQVPGGMFGGDEQCRKGYDDPRQAMETCGMVEQMLSDEILLGITGDPFWAEQCEDVAFNSYPASAMPDFRAIRYLTAPNLVASDEANHAPGIHNSGPFLLMSPLSFRCCRHNHSHGWPYFSENLWLATPDHGLCAAIHAPGTVTAKVGDGVAVSIACATRYPFEETLAYTVRAERAVNFPLYLRIPSWCQGPKLLLNGKEIKLTAAAGRYVRIERLWSDRDSITLELPMKLALRQWAANHDSVSVDYGPLTFSLQIVEKHRTLDSTKATIIGSQWRENIDQRKWPSTAIEPGSPWNYGLVLDQQNALASFAVERRPWPADDVPFTAEAVPLLIRAHGRQIPQWTLDEYGLCAVLQGSPARITTAVEDIVLIPMGAARLRISAFPVAGDSTSGHEWKPSSQPAKKADQR